MKKKSLFSGFLAMTLAVTMMPTLSFAGTTKTDTAKIYETKNAAGSAKIMQLTKAPTIFGAYTVEDYFCLNAEIRHTDEINQLYANFAVNADYWKDTYAYDDASEVYPYIQIAYSFDGGSNWINTQNRKQDLYVGYADDTILIDETRGISACVPTKSLDMALICEKYNVMDLYYFAYDVDDAKIIAGYLSQGKAKMIEDGEDHYPYFSLDLNQNSIQMKARYVLAGEYYDEKSEEWNTVCSYSPWSSVYTYHNQITPETSGATHGGSFTAPVLSYQGRASGDEDTVILTVDANDALAKAISEDYWIRDTGMEEDFFGRYNEYWYWYWEIKINDGEWFYWSVSSADYFTASVFDFDYVSRALNDEYGITLLPTDRLFMRTRLMSDSTERQYLDDSEESDGRYIYVPGEDTVVQTPYSNVVEIPVSNNYQITYHLNWGSFSEGADILYEFDGDTDEVIDLTSEDYTPSRYGYEFAGWYTSQDLAASSQITQINTKNKKFYEIYAKWTTPGEYSITYELGYEEAYNNAYNPTEFTPLMDDIVLEDPYYAGVDFVGWYTNANFTGQKITTIPQGTARDIVVYAKWAFPEYTLTYELNGGSNAAENPAKFQVNPNNSDPEAILTAPGRQGYIFDGWFYDSSFTHALYHNTTNQTWELSADQDTTVYAKWIKGRWDITYIPVVDGVKGTDMIAYNPNPTQYTYGDMVILSNLSASGYTFGGWFLDQACTKAVPKNKLTTSTTEGAKTVYAKWTELEYTITYNPYVSGAVNPSESTITNTNPSSRKASQTVNLLAPVSTDADYVFVGWFTNSNFSGTQVTYVSDSKNVILYGKWKKVKYNITYVLNGGSNHSSNPAKYTLLEDGTNTTILYPATKANYDFAGWYYDETLINKLPGTSSGYSFKSSVDITVYAKWTPKKFNVTYVHPSDLKASVVNTKNPSYYYYGSAFTLTDVSAEGYTFAGWYTDAACTKPASGVSATASGAKTFYSKWTEKEVTITFNVNGGSSKAPSALTKGYWTTIKLPTEVPTKSGYDFYSWNTSADGSGTEYVSGSSYSGNGQITLYAQWRLKFTDVTYGTWQYNTAKYVYDNKIIQGTTSTTFSPNMQLTRGQFIVMLWRMEKQPAVTYQNPYTDVPDGKFFSKAIQWAKNEKLASGWSDGTFRPNDPLTREQFVTFLYRYAKYKKYDVSIGTMTYKSECKDANLVNKVFETQVQWAFERGFIAKNKVISPRNSITRIEAAAILQRFLSFY